MNQNVAVGYSAMYSNATGSQNTALGYRALYQEITPYHLRLLNSINHIDVMLKNNGLEEISENISAVADAYAEFQQAVDKFKLILTLTQPNK